MRVESSRRVGESSQSQRLRCIDPACAAVKYATVPRELLAIRGEMSISDKKRSQMAERIAKNERDNCDDII